MRLLLASSLVLSTILFTGCQSKQANTENAESALPPVVMSTLPVQESTQQTLTLTGVVVPRSQAAIGFQVAGRIQQRLVEVGDTVSAGQLLMRLDDRDYKLKVAALKAQIEATQSDYETAQRTLKRYQDLQKRNLASVQQVDNAQNLVTKLKAQLANLNPQLDQAKNQLFYTQLKAPQAGIITQRQADVGQVVGVGAPVLTIAYHTPSAPNQAVSVQWPETAMPPANRVDINVANHLLTAKLDYVAPQANTASRTYTVHYVIPNNALRLGQSAQVHYEQSTQPAWKVPSTALHTEQDQTTVYQIVQNRLKPVLVTVQRLTDGYAYVQGNLTADTPIVQMGVHVLHPNQTVRVQSHG